MDNLNTQNEDAHADIADEDIESDYLDDEAKLKLRTLDPNFLSDNTLTEFHKNLSVKSVKNETKGKIYYKCYFSIEIKSKLKKKPKEMIINLKYDDDIEKSHYNVPKKKKQ